MTSNWQIGDRIQNRWQIYKILKGGMGIVYVVYDHELHEPYAVKTFQDEIFARNPAVADRFTQEALTWINLDAHQNVTEARFVQKIEGKPFLFLEYVSGGDLSSWTGTPRLTEDLPQVLRFAIQFCDGMTHALAKGITAHRDIKPANCLVTEDKTLKVTDFGLAKVFDDVGQTDVDMPNPQGLSLGLSRTGVAAGTCTHMAPEQFADAKHVDVRADIYSFGVMLYQMVTGKLPFEGQTWQEFERLHKTQMTPSLGTQCPTLSAVVETCLAKNPAQRFADFGVVRESLAEIYERLTGEPAPQPIMVAELNVMQWANKGFSLVELRKCEEAIACYDRALEINPRSDLVWANKGKALLDLERQQEAMVCCDRALEINPRLDTAWTNKGIALNEMGQPEEAMVCHDRALEINPRLEAAWNLKGSALDKLKRPKEAIACYDRALEINPRFEAAWSNKGNTLDKILRYEEAIACYDRSLEIDPYHENPWFNKGVALARLGKSKEALACYDHALEINPGYAEAWANKGVELSNVGEAGEAVACLDRALEINPHDGVAWAGKGAALGKLGQMKEALACCERALEINPHDEKTLFNKGAALGNSGRLHEALECFEEAHRLGHPQAAQAIALCRRMVGQKL